MRNLFRAQGSSGADDPPFPEKPEAILSPLCIFSWLAIQTGGLALGAMRVPLWAHAPSAGEFLSLRILLVVQVLGAALVFPALARNFKSIVVGMATIWPFLALAGLLAAASLSTTLLAAGYVSAWLMVLGIFGASATSRRSRMLLSAIAAGWAAAGPILAFLAHEYRSAPPLSPTAARQAAMGPVVNGLALLDPSASPVGVGPWAPLAVLALIGGGILWGMRALRASAAASSQAAG